MRKTICFDDVLLTPQYSDIKSRKEIEISSHLLHVGILKLPIISSPMDTVTGTSMAVRMGTMGGAGIIHRYNTIEEQAEAVYASKNAGSQVVGAAVGVSGDFLQRAQSLVRAGADIICVDIAHGHHIMMKDALNTLRGDMYVRDAHLMAGNVATLDAFNDLADWGANSIRVGIGGGSICSTRIQTGHGMPTLASIMECAQSSRDAALIADGGIRNSGDIVKSLAAGADFVMLGSLLSGTDEAPGDVIHSSDGQRFKAYRGMASIEAQVEWRGHASSIEGVVTKTPYKGSVVNIIEDLCAGIRSGFSYTGSKNIKAFHARCDFILQSNASMNESFPHALL